MDVIAEDDASRYILQAKNSITSNRKGLNEDLDKIIRQFNKIEKTYVIEGKGIKKILFAINWSWDMEV